ncbi:MAG: CotH kinase family protein [Pirellulales bacterium]
MRLPTVLLSILLGLVCGGLRATEPELFGPTTKHDVRLTIAAEDYAKLEPKQPRGPGGFGARPPAGPGRPAPGSADFGAGSFGYEFEYVRADVEIDGAAFQNIGVRYKGNGTYVMSARQTKRSWKLDFDRYDEKQTFHDEKKLNLNSGVMDPTKAREILAYEIFRAAGVPAPRTALAEVTLTVPGKFDREHLGVYTLVEQVDKPFLKTHFRSAKGLLLKPEGIRGLPYFGENGADYDASYHAKTETRPEQWDRLVALTRLINRADEATFRREIGEVLDVPAFARFLAVNTLLSSMDGFIGLGHNYYLYLRPDTNRFVFFPWDLDLAFGAFPMYGTPQQLLDLSIDHPHVGENKLIDRLLAMPEFKTAYREELRKLVDDVFTTETLGERIRTVETALRPLLENDKAAAAARKEGAQAMGPGGGMFNAPQVPLDEFVRKRAASVKAQLAGESKGHVPTQGGFGFGGPPGGFNPGQQLAKPLLDALDADKNGEASTEEFDAGMRKFAREWDADKNGALSQQELADGLRKLIPAPNVRQQGGPPGRP